MLKSSLRKLDRFLSDPEHGDDVMLLSELDGFLAGVAVCPELIMPGEWLEVVWGEDGPVFTSERQASGVLGLIIGHYNDILRQLNTPGRYAPLLEQDRDGSPLWELWASGFAKAVALRPDAWADFTISEGPAVHRAMAFFRKLDELANQPGDQFTEMDNALDAVAPELIPKCLEEFHLARLGLLDPAKPSEAPRTPHKSVGTICVPAARVRSSRSAASTDPCQLRRYPTSRRDRAEDLG
ncbi:UPF0149 family protein [Rubellimicrobium aerolatum]|uniref:UPF0149 family protein n=1 Tax=Rubellimicrobium aerolatum TaxID=490979 RepID=UPI001AE77D13|nr:UPF0149 family protein [Rubellimicrobium aerolatum]MBP1807761.1 uncharacterized protein [Rubellimicrobium aerolatum]